MIYKEKCMNFILKNVPSFAKSWEEYTEFWDNEAAGLCNDISEFSKYVTNLIITNKTEELPRIFNIVETLIVDGNSDVKDAVSTCFLENLINRVSSGVISAKSFVGLLGPESYKYCKSWDQFTGVYTEGL